MRPVPHMVVHYASLLTGWPGVQMLAAMLIGTAVLWAWTRGPLARVDRRVGWVILVPALAWGLWSAWKQRAIFDDAYISFRYIDNLFAGNGLVFNPGEYVEGYSNPLWVALVAAAHGLTGLEIPLAAVILNVLVYLALVAAMGLAGHRLTSGLNPPHLPIAAALLACERSIAAYATTGMETLLGVLLVVLAAAALARPNPRSSLWAGVLLALAVTHRLDHALFWVAGLAAVAVHPEQRWAALRNYLAPVTLVLALLAFKLAYYGDILPNTYYAKSAYAWSPLRGLDYMGSFLLGSHSWLLLLPFAGWLVVALRDPASRPVAVYAGVSTGLWFVYLLKVGGDFMYARFCLPVLPLILLGAVSAARRLPDRPWRWGVWAVVLATLGGLNFLPVGRGRTWGVVDENRAYALIGFDPVEIRHASYYEGRFFKRVLTDRGIDVYLGSCCIGMVSYYSKQRVLDFHGLTDREVARMERFNGVAGHDKYASPDRIRERGVQIARWHDKDPRSMRPITRIHFPNGGPVWKLRRVYSIMIYDAELVQRIADEVPEMWIRPLHPWLDEYIREINQKRVRQVRRDYEFLKKFYFAYNEDPQRQGAFEERLGLNRRPAPKGPSKR